MVLERWLHRALSRVRLGETRRPDRKPLGNAVPRHETRVLGAMLRVVCGDADPEDLGPVPATISCFGREKGSRGSRSSAEVGLSASKPMEPDVRQPLSGEHRHTPAERGSVPACRDSCSGTSPRSKRKPREKTRGLSAWTDLSPSEPQRLGWGDVHKLAACPSRSVAAQNNLRQRHRV